jgi:fatty-acyl-CoA synthase
MSTIQRASSAYLISKFAVPQSIHRVEAIPKTSAGKIDKKRLRAQYAE